MARFATRSTQPAKHKTPLENCHMFDTTKAACAGSRDLSWLRDSTDVPEWLKQKCYRCPLRITCLEWALAHDEHGVWAGTSYPARKSIRAGNRVASCPVCQSEQLFPLHRGRVCGSCGISWHVRPAIDERARRAAAASTPPPTPPATATRSSHTSTPPPLPEPGRIPVHGLLRPQPAA